MTSAVGDFRQAMGEFATGVTVVTTTDGQGRPYGVTVNAFSSLSIDPMLVLVCLDGKLSGIPLFEESGRFGINVLAEDQEEASTYFSLPGTDRSRFDFREPNGVVPLLKGCLAWIQCRLTDVREGGDHRILLGEVTDLELNRRPLKPLLFFRGRYLSIQGD